VKKKIDEVMDLLDLNELVSVKRDLDSGGERLGKLVSLRIKDELKKHSNFCCVCNAKLDPYSVSNFTLIFGPDDMKKKATFCAIDCLEHFLANLKDFFGDDNQTFIKNKKR